MKNYLLIILMAGLFAACKKPAGFEYRRLENFRIESLGLASSRIGGNMVYNNPNNFGVTLKRVDADVFIDNDSIGHFILDTTIYVPRHAEFSVPVTMNVGMEKLFKNALGAIFGNEVQLRVTGSARAGRSGLFFNFPFTYEGKHKL